MLGVRLDAVSHLEILLLAVGLAMDATAVAGARGLAATRIRPRDALVVGAMFGGAQAAMPALGWVAGAAFAARIMAWGHWVTFGVLGAIGLKMIREAWSAPRRDEEAEQTRDPFDLRVLFALALAARIDALAAGVSLALRRANLFAACATIGLVTAALSSGGVYLGHRYGARFDRRIEILGGVVLLGLAVASVV